MTSHSDVSARIAKELDRLDADIVHVGLFDFATMFRERRLRREDLLSGADHAVFANVLPKWDAAESILAPGPYGSETIAYDPDSIRPYPFEPRAVALVADYTGPQAEIMPRRVLARQVERARAAGLDVLAAYEFEFILLNETADSLRAKGFADLSHFAADNRCWSGQTAATYASFVADLESLLRAADIDLFALGVELGPGCLEATLRHKAAMRAADDAAFFRMFTKAFCRQRGLTASFMPLLGAGFPGIGGHVCLSLRNRQSGRNLFADAHQRYGLSEAAQSFLAGIIDMVPEAFPMCAHTVNAYRRFAPGSWAPKTVSWAPYNYAAAVRTAAETEEATRLELRLPGSDVNVYLALALMLGAGLEGLERGLALADEPIGSGGPNEIPADAPRLPSDLREATQRFRASDKVRRLFGVAFVDHFAMLCEAEDAALRRAVSAAEVQRYLEAG
ncbi:type I glutamate--ammonia ligase [Dongia deserti]|uniref:glutamine synthetase n=1 Tax=Dongia deserti TaxID=2268030 RepID=UPI000E65777F|nr:glutamine synthetase [Dongia deserti]